MGERTPLQRLSEQEGFKDCFLTPDDANFDHLIYRMKAFFCASLERSGRGSGRRWIREFKYAEELSDFIFPIQGIPPEAVAQALGSCFEGTIRWHHPNAAFNITPSPHFDTVAAASVATLLNPNCLWDFTSGRMLLAEQRIAKAIGEVIFPGEPVGGFSTFGGKATLMYGIKMGMANCDRAHKRDGLRCRQAILASSTAHYSLEDVADYLGLGTSAVIRVPCDNTGSMDLLQFSTTLDECLSAGIRIASVIVNGGVTIDFSIDDASAIRKICSRMQAIHHLDYTIHLHGDTVAGWAWLLADGGPLTDGSIGSGKVLEAKRRLACIQHADSAGIDFHKTGLCPYTTTFFLLKRRERLHQLGGHLGVPDLDTRHGELHLHHSTMENSRPASGIVAAYTSMLRLGREGLARYLRYQMDVRLTYHRLISNHFSDLLKPLNPNSLGFEIVLAANRPGGDALDMQSYLAVRSHLQDANGSDPAPTVGFVPRYWNGSDHVPALLIYPMSPHSDEDACMTLLLQLRKAVLATCSGAPTQGTTSLRADLTPPR